MIALLSEKRNLYGCFQKNRVTLNSDFKKDIEWWTEFLPKWNGSYSFLEINWTCSDVLQLFTDASSTLGYRAYFPSAWLQGHWPVSLLSLKPSIKFLKILAVLFALTVWKKLFFKKRPVLHCDNLGAVLYFQWRP